jgi:hypothetical protein
MRTKELALKDVYEERDHCGDSMYVARIEHRAMACNVYSYSLNKFLWVLWVHNHPMQAGIVTGRFDEAVQYTNERLLKYYKDNEK